jgi:hypothetical protein
MTMGILLRMKTEAGTFITVEAPTMQEALDKAGGQGVVRLDLMREIMLGDRKIAVPEAEIIDR